MPAMALAELTGLIAPPARPTRTGRRIDADGRTLELPADYRELLAVYGPGTFGEGLAIYAPDMAGTAFDIVDKTRIMTRPRDPESELPRYPPWPQPDSLLMWGFADDSEELYWHTEGEPDDWPVIAIRGREELHARIDLTATEVIVAMFTGRPVLPSFLPDLSQWTLDFKPFPTPSDNRR